MLAGAITLLEDLGLPAATDDLKGLGDNLQALAPLLEQEMNTVILSCARARTREMPQTKPTVH